MEKRKKFLQAQLKSKKIVLPPAPAKKVLKDEKLKKNGQQKEAKKSIEKAIESRKRFREENRSREDSEGRGCRVSHSKV